MEDRHALAQTAFRIKRHKSLCSHRRANRVCGHSIADASSLRLIGAGKHEAALLRLLDWVFKSANADRKIMFRKLTNRAAYGLFYGRMRSANRFGEASDTSKKTMNSMNCRHGSHWKMRPRSFIDSLQTGQQRWVVGTPETSRCVRRRFWPDAQRCCGFPSRYAGTRRSVHSSSVPPPCLGNPEPSCALR
jgi:hypothetical protein